MMKKIIVSGLFASLFWLAPAQANEINGNNDSCLQSKNSGGCPNYPSGQYNPPPQPPHPGFPPPPPFHPPADYGDGYGYGWHHRRPAGVYFNFQVDPSYDNYDTNNYDDYNYVNRCTKIARSLSNSGFRHVRAIGCGGRYYYYTALRGGERLRLTVSSYSGRIVKIRPVY